MISPFENIDNAFSPFFDDAFSVNTKDGLKTTLVACLFQDMTAEPLTDSAMESTSENIMIVVKEDDWPWVKTNVQRGNSVVHDKTQKKYKVVSVDDDFVAGKIIRARAC